MWSDVVGFSFQALAHDSGNAHESQAGVLGRGGGGLGQQPHTDQVLAIIFRGLRLCTNSVRLQHSVSAMDLHMCPCAGFGCYGPAEIVLYPRVAVAITYAYSGTPPMPGNMFIPSIIARKCGPSTQPIDQPKKHSGALIAAYM
jgi:hypothetical protein